MVGCVDDLLYCLLLCVVVDRLVVVVEVHCNRVVVWAVIIAVAEGLVGSTTAWALA